MRAYAPLEHCFVLLERTGRTGHYHLALLEYLLEFGLAMYLVHVQRRHAGLLKTDKRDARGLPDQLFNQLEKGVQLGDTTQLVRRAVPPTEVALLLRSLVQHREELSCEATQRRNQLTAICDVLFPEFTQVFKDPNRASALAVRERFPTPATLATASLAARRAARVGRRPSDADLARLQDLAQASIGAPDLGRQRRLILEQAQLIADLRFLRTHLEQLDAEIAPIVQHARAGQILLSMPRIGPSRRQRSWLLLAIWPYRQLPQRRRAQGLLWLGAAHRVLRSGVTLNQATLTRSGQRSLRKMLFLAVGNAFRMDWMDCEWSGRGWMSVSSPASAPMTSEPRTTVAR
jgi:transposase